MFCRLLLPHPKQGKRRELEPTQKIIVLREKGGLDGREGARSPLKWSRSHNPPSCAEREIRTPSCCRNYHERGKLCEGLRGTLTPPRDSIRITRRCQNWLFCPLPAFRQRRIIVQVQRLFAGVRLSTPSTHAVYRVSYRTACPVWDVDVDACNTGASRAPSKWCGPARCAPHLGA